MDGSTGEIFVNPTAEKKGQLEAEAAERKAALAASTGPGATSDGHKVPLLANIGGPARTCPRRSRPGRRASVSSVPSSSSSTTARAAPSEESRVTAYRQVLEAFPEGRVVVRVLDAGADKPLDFLTPGDEPTRRWACEGCGRCSTTRTCCARS